MLTEVQLGPKSDATGMNMWRMPQTRTSGEPTNTTSDAPDNSGPSRLPPLQTETGNLARTNGEKGEVLMKTFFPEPPDATLDDIVDYDYDEPLPMEPIQSDDIAKVVALLSPYRAPGPSGIPNIAIQKACPFILAPLTTICNASIRLSHVPDRWKAFTTIALRKPGKDDYTKAKSYRPTALEEALGKVVEAAIARNISMLAERYNLLPANHFGGRPNRCTTDALLYLTQRVKDAWRKGNVISVLFLDISQAFPTVSHERLLHNLKKRQAPSELVNWTADFLRNRRTSLCFDDYKSELLSASHGIPQGSPLSLIPYLFYSADLIELISPKDRRQLSAGWVDDTLLATEAPTVEETVRMFSDLAPAVCEWRKTHACRFDVAKFNLVHFTRNDARYTPTALTFEDTTVPTETAKYLGLILDRKLRWKPQIAAAVAKGTKALLGIARLARPTFGLPQKYIRRLVVGVALPRMEYGMPVFFEPTRRSTTPPRFRGSIGPARQFTTVQRMASRLITGAFKTTATSVLDYRSGLAPTRLRLNRIAHNAVVRIATLPKPHPLHSVFQRCRRYPRFHHSPIHEMRNAFPWVTSMEHIDPSTQEMTLQPRCTYSVNPSSELALAQATERQTNSLCVFSDGSGHQGMVGAAAIALPQRNNPTFKSRRHCSITDLRQIPGRYAYIVCS